MNGPCAKGCTLSGFKVHAKGDPDGYGRASPGGETSAYSRNLNLLSHLMSETCSIRYDQQLIVIYVSMHNNTE